MKTEENSPLHAVGAITDERGDGLVKHALAHVALIELFHGDRVVLAQQHAEIGVIEETAQLVQREGGRVVQNALQRVRREGVVVDREEMLQVASTLLLRYPSFFHATNTRHAVEHSLALEVLELVLQRERRFGTHHDDAFGAHRTQLLTESLLHRATLQQLCGTGRVGSRDSSRHLLVERIPVDCFDEDDDGFLERRVEGVRLREDGVRVRLAVLL